MKYLYHITILLTATILLNSCKKGKHTDPAEAYVPTPYKITIPQGFPELYIDKNNTLTIEGVQLGRMLYYDSLLDINSARTCATCHFQDESFSLQSVNSLAHLNLGWNRAYLWNGKIEGSLEDIMLFEVEKFFKTDLTKFNTHDTYPELFKKAFNVDEISSKELAFALAQFTRTMISANSKWDKYLRGEASLTQAEAQGFEIFFTEKGDCFHCHGTILFTDNLFHNNGLDSNPEQGRAEITGNPNDVGKFKSPTLRNIMLTPPYMHDGRYATIEEVVDFYSEDIKWSATIDPLMKKVDVGGLHLNQQDKENLIAFLKTLTDTTFTTNSELSNPFIN